MIAISFICVCAAVCACALALGALLRGRQNVSNWAFAIGMFVLAAEALCAQMTERSGWFERWRWQQWRLIADSFLPAIWILFSLTYARANAREFIVRWKLVLAGALALPVGLTAVAYEQLLVDANPGHVRSAVLYPLGWSGMGLQMVLLVSSVFILMNLERTFRASVGTMRWRIKFVLIAVGLLFMVRIYTSSQALLFRSISLPMESFDGGALLVAAFVALRGFFRTGRIQLDVHPSHSVLQGSITVLLSGTYLVLVGIAARLVTYFGGGRWFAWEALWILGSLVVFVVLLQSDRLRLSLGQFVSRHFDRPLYDYRLVWRRFTDATASPVDQDELCRSLVKLVADVFRCLSVAIWIIDDRNEALTLAASTFLSETKGRELALSRAEAAVVLEHFRRHPGPADIETSTATFAVLLRRAHPSEFPARENRVCLPMAVRGEILALLVLGDHVGGAAFSTQDFDMLRCVGDHATASLLNLRQGQQLLQAKEMEAFQTMAAFFVHDLKNAASILSLMLKNLPVHFEDPAFREDALRGVSKSVDHINHVIGRLSQLRGELALRSADADLNAVVDGAVAGLGGGSEFSLTKELRPMPKVSLDREQIAKVVTNLVLNAKEAMGGKGEVRLSTARENGWVVLQVTDRGCGMSEEFMQRSLFRPFQTTKKNGLGIGMFQSKMIVEAHGGRLAVTSEVGAGTTFQMYLPLHPRV